MAKARVPSEAAEGVALSKWLTAHGIAHVHIPNGIKIGGDRRGAAGQIACLKDQGMQPGAPDYLIFGPLPDGLEACGVAIELKTRDAPYGEPWGVQVHAKWLRPNQAAWLERLSQLGYEAYVLVPDGVSVQLVTWRCRACAGSKDAIEFLQSLGFGKGAEPVESVHMSEANNEAAPTSATDAADAVLVALGSASGTGSSTISGQPLMTSKQLQAATGLDAATLRKTLAKLGSRIVKTGTKRGTRYALATEVE